MLGMHGEWWSSTNENPILTCTTLWTQGYLVPQAGALPFISWIQAGLLGFCPSPVMQLISSSRRVAGKIHSLLFPGAEFLWNCGCLEPRSSNQLVSHVMISLEIICSFASLTWVVFVQAIVWVSDGICHWTIGGRDCDPIPPWMGFVREHHGYTSQNMVDSAGCFHRNQSWDTSEGGIAWGILYSEFAWISLIGVCSWDLLGDFEGL